MECYKINTVSLMKPTEKKLHYHMVIWIFGFFIYSYILYIRNPISSNDLQFIKWDFLSLLPVLFGMYLELSVVSNSISRLAMEIEIGEGEILLHTTPFNFLWINRPTTILKYRQGEFTVKKVVYPISHIFNTFEKLLQLNNLGTYTYILTSFLDPALEGKVMAMRDC